MVKKPPTRGERFLKLAGMTASVASRYASTRVKTLFQNADTAAETWRHNHEQAGGRIAETLGELKGAVMKVGQMASIAADVLPKELASALTRLQREAPPMDFAVIAEQIEAELGAPPERLFARFDEEPFASASIGQVHRAQTDDGREVVCKVQYPGVDAAVDSDLQQLKLALRASGLARVPRKDLNAIFAELRRVLHEELDYTIEAQHVRLFRDFHGPRHPFVVIPEVVGERSSQRVLTLTYVGGDSLQEAKQYSAAARDTLGEHLLTLMCSQLFSFGAIHGDPNPANLAFRPDGSIVLYDFGCIKRIPREIVQAYRDAIVLGLEEDYAGVEDALMRLGVRNPSGPPVDPEYYKGWRDIFALPFLDSPLFDFSEARIHDGVLKQVPGMMKRLSSFRPAKHLLFVNRMVAGHYGNLCHLQPRVEVLARISPYLREFDPAALEGSPPEDPAAEASEA